MKYLQKTAPNEKFVNLADRMRKKIKEATFALVKRTQIHTIKIHTRIFFSEYDHDVLLFGSLFAFRIAYYKIL